MNERPPSPAGLIISGVFLWAAFFFCSYGLIGMSITYMPPWHNFAASELMFWVATLIFLLPGSLFIGSALAPPLLVICLPRLSEMRQANRHRAPAMLLIFALAFLWSVLGHHLVLLGFPITDDENAARLGGQILASGSWRAAVPAAWEAFPKIFFYTHEASASYQSFDWPGILFAWAFAELSALDATIFQFAAGLTPALIFWGVERRSGLNAALVAVALYLCAPMAMTLSWTSHAHVLSRCAVAGVFALAVSLVGEQAGSGRALMRWGALGAIWGVGLLIRPLEVFTVCAPVIVLISWQRLKARELRAIAALSAGVGVFAALFMYSNYAITGDALVQARFAVLDAGTSAHHKPPLGFLSDPVLLLSRLSNNLVYNIFNLLLWFATPLALPLVWLGARRDAFTHAVALGIIWSLLLTLLHDDFGLHIVGPIHYSEAVIPLVYLFALGLMFIFKNLVDHGRRIAVSIVVALVLTGSFVSLWQGFYLYKQARIHQHIYSTFEDDPRYNNSVILVPQYGAVWRSIPEFAATGSFVFQWRPVSPSRDEQVIFLHHVPQLIPQLVEQFPQRSFFVMTPIQQPPYLTAIPLQDHMQRQPPRAP